MMTQPKIAGQKHRHTGTYVMEGFTLLLFLLFMTPFFIVLINSSKSTAEIVLNPVGLPTDYTLIFQNIKTILQLPTTDYIGAFFDSCIITVLSLAVITLFSAMSAWVLVRNKTKWSTAIFMIFVSAMVIPFQVVMYPLVKWFKALGDVIGIRMLGSYQGIVFAYLGFGCSMSIFILHGFIKGVPLELEEAATIDGCSQARTFFTIVLPLLQPPFITVLILNGIWIWNDFLLPLLVLGTTGEVQTIPLAVMNFVGSYVKQWDLILTSTLLAMLPIIILFIFAQRYIIKGMVEGSIK